MATLTKVSLNMTDRDLENVKVIAALPAVKNRTHAVGTALSFTRFIVDFLREHPSAELILRDGSDFTRVLMPELQPTRPGGEGRPAKGRKADAPNPQYEVA